MYMFGDKGAIQMFYCTKVTNVICCTSKSLDISHIIMNDDATIFILSFDIPCFNMIFFLMYFYINNVGF